MRATSNLHTQASVATAAFGGEMLMVIEGPEQGLSGCE
jgi:hypothetical protein